MHKPDPRSEDIEKALLRLMPVAVNQDAQDRMDLMLDELAANEELVRFDFRKSVKWLAGGGIAAAFSLGVYFTLPHEETEGSPVSEQTDRQPDLVFLSESDRVEGFSDEGLFVDTGGSAVRKVSIRVVGESRIRDEETGIVVMLTEPREEMYMVPVSTF